MPTVTIEPNSTTTATAPNLALTEASFSVLPVTEDMVLVRGGWLPREQEYYWSAEWQADEQESLREMASGGAVEFDNTEDLIRWLFSPDED